MNTFKMAGGLPLAPSKLDHLRKKLLLYLVKNVNNKCNVLRAIAVLKSAYYTCLS